MILKLLAGSVGLGNLESFLLTPTLGLTLKLVSGFLCLAGTRKQSFFRYNSPLVLVSIIGLACFCCPGMYWALVGMGGGGHVDPMAMNNANTALYATFAIFGILGGGIYNVLGPRLTLASGCSTYALYAGSFLYYNHYHHHTFAIIAGAILGIGVGFLWASQGAIMTSYPLHNQKGTYISLYWSIFRNLMGGVVGGFIPCILNYNRTEAVSVTDATYIGFMCFMTVGALLSLAILPPSKVIRNDGTSCTNIKYSSVSTEATEILKLFLNWKMLLIVPAAWVSNFFYSYQFTNVNGALFNLRTRGLNNVFYWVAQILGSIGIGYVLDFSLPSQKMRGYVGIAIVALLGTVIWGGGLASQLKYSRHDLPKKLDFRDSGSDYAVRVIFQLWIVGRNAPDLGLLYTGFYKGVQSAGAVVAWQIDTCKVPFLSELIVNWSLMTMSYPLLVVLVKLAVKEDEGGEEGAKKAVASSFAH
ncbi:hypothetical protein ACJRO7_006684 [Eucalyptus globulus]|uniref:Uncharacterized protein n=1 Tax=Eucalyptus globulus TaxID=34317 RepID=A0ABD3INL7_EUCGL